MRTYWLIGCTGLFLTAAQGSVTYVDAIVGTGANTTLADGTVMVDGIHYSSTSTAADGLWNLRAFANNGTMICSNDGGAEDAPRLRTTVTGLTPGTTYDVYAYFWGANGVNWRGRAGLVDTVDALPGYNSSHFVGSGFSPMTAVSVNITGGENPGPLTTSDGGDPAFETGGYFANTVMTEEGNRALYEVSLGPVEADGGGEIVVFIDDLENTSNANRSWYDGIGYEEVSDLPVVDVSPVDTVIVLGQSSSLDVTASASLPISYQWRKENLPLAGATNSTLTISSATPAGDAGNYDVIASTTGGSATSDVAVVTVGLPSVQPTSQVALQGFDATFMITMPTNVVYTYQWAAGSTPLPGKTDATLVLEGVSGPDAGMYSVAVTLGGDTLSASAELLVPAVPTEGYADTILTSAPVGYWRLDEAFGSPQVADATFFGYALNTGLNTQLGQPGALLGDTGTAAGFDGTDGAILDGTASSSILNPAVFSVECWARPTGGSGRRTAVGSRDLVAANWIEGYELGLNDSGQWEFRTGEGSGVDAGWNTLTGPAAEMGAWSQIVGTFDGSTMQLYLNGAPVGSLPVSAFSPQLIWPLRLGGGGNEAPAPTDLFTGDLDEVAVYNRALTATEVLDHYAASYDVTVPPIITTQPEDQVVLIGTQGMFQVSVLTGTGPSYQWRLDGAAIPGADEASYVMDPVVLTDAGIYDVVVGNAAGSVTSETARLVPLLDYVGTMVLPDSTNTVLTRDGSSDWFVIETAPVADAAGKWTRRSVFNILGGVAPWAFQSTAAGATNGSREVRTTISDLQPNTEYAVWTLYSDKATQRLSDINTSFDGEPLQRFTPANGIPTGLIAVSADPGWPVYHCYLGVRTSDGLGNISVLADYPDGAGRTVYHGVGYQLAVPPVEVPSITIPPVSQAVLIGSNATFSVSASSAVPMTYQWEFEGTALTGETNDTLTVMSVQRADAGIYRVQVSNSEGGVFSPDTHLVALEDYVGTFILPNGGNTVLTRNASPDWIATNQADAVANGQWWARADFAIPGVPGSTEGYLVEAAMENTADVEVRTTLTGLDPGEDYAIWMLYSYPPGGTSARIAAGFEGSILTIWEDDSGKAIGEINGPTDNWAVYQAFLGVLSPDGTGTVSVRVDYEGLQNSVYNGLGYQLAVLPEELLMEIGLENGSIVLNWPAESGTLQETIDLTDPAGWSDVPGATPPYPLPTTEPKQSFRILPQP